MLIAPRLQPQATSSSSESLTVSPTSFRRRLNTCLCSFKMYAPAAISARNRFLSSIASVSGGSIRSALQIYPLNHLVSLKNSTVM